jgi:2-(1,2-epoxy-1,2-dihydrophenyl)acetyl-CoA isomerase
VADPQLETLRLDRSGGVLTITLDRPGRKNAINQQMWDELLATFRDLQGDREARAVVLTGAGGEFCSGADLTPGQPGPNDLTGMRQVADVCLALHRLPQPTLARVDGVAAGAGLNLALSCDLIVASRRARFSQIFAKRGLSLDFGGSWLLPRLVGLHKAKELALFGDIIDAAEAERIGLVNRVVDDGELDGLVEGWAARLAAGPPTALSLTKRMLNDAFERTLEEAVEDEARSQVVNFSGPDVAEAVGAWFEKREPRFGDR